KPLEEVLNL
nr:Chain E, ANTIGENIC NONAPEPTIDE [synthetic construct]7YZJ_E Chain E, Antigenic peptide [Homo sapiens]